MHFKPSHKFSHWLNVNVNVNLFVGEASSMYLKKPNSAKLVMQMSEKEGEPEPVWNRAVSLFLRTRILGIACEVELSLIFFSLEQAHVQFGFKHKHIV